MLSILNRSCACEPVGNDTIYMTMMNLLCPHSRLIPVPSHTAMYSYIRYTPMYPFFHSLMYPFFHSLMYPFFHSLMYPFFHSLMYPFFHSPILSCMHSLMHAFFHAIISHSLQLRCWLTVNGEGVDDKKQRIDNDHHVYTIT